MRPHPDPGTPGLEATMKRASVRRILGLVIAFGALARIATLWFPIYEWHYWKQMDTAAVARNFYEGGMRLGYPTIDWAPDTPGYVESEFPLYAYGVAILYKVFGPHEALARLLNVGIFVASALVLFALARRLYDEVSGLIAVGLYAIVPLGFFYTRNFQPDGLVAFCGLAGVYAFWKWTEEDRPRDLALAGLAVGLAILLKPPMGFVAVPIGYLCARKFGWQMFKQPALWLFAVAALAPAAVWYRHAHGFWVDYRNSFGVFGGWVKVERWGPFDGRWRALAFLFRDRLVTEIATPAGIIFLVGILTRPPKNNWLIQAWFAGFLVSVIVLPGGHAAHDYYQLPILFALLAGMGYGATLLWRKAILGRPVLAALGVVILVLSISKIHVLLTQSAVDPFTRDARLAFGAFVEQKTEPGSKIVFGMPEQGGVEWMRRTTWGDVSYVEPLDTYLSHRKGWTIGHKQATEERLAAFQRNGARYFATFYPDQFEKVPDFLRHLEDCHTSLGEGRSVLYRLEGRCGETDPAVARRSKHDSVTAER
jgi:4-amino-4-deoxy-L-arabinose transferase-like glycosyltransferase